MFFMIFEEIAASFYQFLEELRSKRRRRRAKAPKRGS